MKENRTTISLRLPDTVINKADAKAQELDTTRTEVIEKALRCFLGIGFEPECENLSEFQDLKELVATLIKANNLKTSVDSE